MLERWDLCFIAKGRRILLVAKKLNKSVLPGQRYCGYSEPAKAAKKCCDVGNFLTPKKKNAFVPLKRLNTTF